MGGLTFAIDVKRTPMTDAVIEKLQPIFVANNFTAYITSVLRDKDDQLRLIQQYAIEHGIIPGGTILNFVDTEYFEGKQVYVWQVVWSTLLNHGIIINPAVSAVVLMDYWRDGINKKGLTLPASPHAGGKAFDVGGFSPNNTINRCYQILMNAASGVGIKDVLEEHGNNCCHVDVV
jgi:hypothetical protein